MSKCSGRVEMALGVVNFYCTNPVQEATSVVVTSLHGDQQLAVICDRYCILTVHDHATIITGISWNEIVIFSTIQVPNLDLLLAYGKAVG